MKNQRHSSTHTTTRRNGLSLLEVVVSTMLVGVVLLGATDLLGSVISGRTEISDQAVGELLAQQLMAEILSAHYEDPNAPAFGVESDESAYDRSTFDDVDDYNNWGEEEAADAVGQPLMNTTGWSREVAVDYVDSSDVATAVGTDSGLKRISVEVKRNGETIHQLVTLRSNISH